MSFSRTHRLFLCAALAVAARAHAQLSDASPSGGAGVTVPYETYNAVFNALYGFGSANSSLSGNQLIPPAVGQSFTGSSSATVTAGLDPVVSSSAGIDVTANDAGSVNLTDNSFASLQYQFQIEGAPSADVAVGLSALLSFAEEDNGTPNGSDGAAYGASVDFQIFDNDINDAWSGEVDPGSPTLWSDSSSANPFSGTIDTTLDLATDTIYNVYISTDAVIYSLPDSPTPGDYSLTATVDPLFTAPTGYTIDFSPNLVPLQGSVPDAADTMVLAAISAASLLLELSWPRRSQRRAIPARIASASAPVR